MNKEIGYVGYTLLKLDMIRFDGDGQIKFQMPQDLRTLAKIIRVLGLNSITELKTSEMSIMEYLETLIWSMILSGHYMSLITLDSNGQVKLRKAYTYPGSHFLSGIYKNFIGNIPDSIYHLAIIYNFQKFLSERDHNTLISTLRSGVFDPSLYVDRYRGGEYWETDRDIIFRGPEIQYKGIEYKILGQEDQTGRSYCLYTSTMNLLYSLLKVGDGRANYWLSKIYEENYQELYSEYPTAENFIKNLNDNPQEVWTYIISKVEAGTWGIQSMANSLNFLYKEAYMIEELGYLDVLEMGKNWIYTPTFIDNIPENILQSFYDAGGTVLDREDIASYISTSITEHNERFVVELYGYVSGVPLSRPDDHWVVILDYIKEGDNGWFLIFDSDAPFARDGESQGQAVWVHEEIITLTFRRGTILSYEIN